MTDSVMGTWSYTYDDFNRLMSGSATAGVDNGLTLGWTYDRYGNRWAQNATGSGNASAVQPQLSFANTNQVSGWSYDAAGNLLNDGRNSYQYDAEGRIVKLNGAPTYVYDAEGRRVAKYSGGTISSSYLLGLGGEQVTEFNNTGGWVHSNVWAGSKLLATYEGTSGPHPNTWHFHLTDWLGTERMQNTAAGNNEEVCYSYPFGDGLYCTGNADATEHHFTSKERDTESGLDYFEARYLNSDLARFMTPDWADKPTDVPYAQFGDPQSLNLYAYVRNNPLIRVDADGHIDWDYLKDKFEQVFYAKVSVGVGLGGELKLTKNAGFKAEVKAGVETRATANGERTVAKVEASAGVKLGGKEIGKSASVEMQIEKNGKVDIQKPTFECCTTTVKSGSAEGTSSGNDIGIGGHEGALGGEVGIDVDKAREFGQAVKDQVNNAIDNTIKKILPN
jgi:RHS repeat-associated protein